MVSKSSRISDIWNLFRSRILSEVKTVTLLNNTIVTVSRYSSAYSQEELSVSSNFPMIVIEPPRISDKSKTFSKEETTGTINIEVYGTSAEIADRFSDKILDTIETYKKILADNGLTDVHGSLEDIDSDSPGGFLVHVRRLRFEFTYKYTKTRAY